MDRLLQLLRERSLTRGEVVLTSGRKSDWLVDCKQTVLLAEGHHLVGQRMLERVRQIEPPVAAVAGVALGGCPLASAVSLTSFTQGEPLDALYIRKERKEHGSARRIEGDDRLRAGAAVAVLEDVVTTGRSTLEAVNRIRDRGFEVAGVVALVDRQEGGSAALAEAAIPFEALYVRADFVSDP